MIAPFLYSVDSLLATFPDYASVVKRPIDLLIIKQRLQDGEYDDISQVDSDMRLMFSNASKYNAAHDPVAIAATQFQQLWAEKLRSVPPKYVSRDSSEDPIGGTPDYDSEDEHGKFTHSGSLYETDNQTRSDLLVIEIKLPKSKARLRNSRVDKLSDTQADLENPSRKLPLLLLEKLPGVLLMVMGAPKRLERPKSTRMTMMTRSPSSRHHKRKIWQTKYKLRMLLFSTRL